MSDFLQRSGTALSEPSELSTHTPPRKKNETRSLVLYTLLALGLALCIRFFIASPYVVLGSSMESNFHNWDYLITDRISYSFEKPERGDVVVFHLPHEYSRTLIKRVVGVPGDTITATRDSVRIVNDANPEGFLLQEEYLSAENKGGPNGTTVVLKESEYFVLGDNRRVSSDSRTWGVLPEDHIIGRVLVRLFPLSAIGIFPAEARYGE